MQLYYPMNGGGLGEGPTGFHREGGKGGKEKRGTEMNTDFSRMGTDKESVKIFFVRSHLYY